MACDAAPLPPAEFTVRSYTEGLPGCTLRRAVCDRPRPEEVIFSDRNRPEPAGLMMSAVVKQWTQLVKQKQS